METILLITSIILFHLPLTLFKDTARRLERMEQSNSYMAFSYTYDNGELSAYSLSTILYFISSLFFALIPLISGFALNWLLAIILNIALSFFIIPFVAFIIYPSNSILTKRSLKTIGVFCITVAFVLWGICNYKVL